MGSSLKSGRALAVLAVVLSAAPARAADGPQTIAQAVPGYSQLPPKYQELWNEVFLHRLRGDPALTPREQWLVSNYDFLLAPTSDPGEKKIVAQTLFGGDGTLPEELTRAIADDRTAVALPQPLADPSVLDLDARTHQSARPNAAQLLAMTRENADLVDRALPQAGFAAAAPPPANAAAGAAATIGAPEPDDAGAGAPAPGSSADSGGAGRGGATTNGGAAPPGAATDAGAAPGTSGNKALAALQGGAFGPDKRDALPDPTTRASAADGARADATARSAAGGGASAAAATNAPGRAARQTRARDDLAAGPAYAAPSTRAIASARGDAIAGRASAPAFGPSGGPGLAAGGAEGTPSPLGAPKIGPPGPPDAAPKGDASPPADADDALSAEEKKELDEIRRLLKEAADSESGALDAPALEAAADRLPDASPNVRRVKDRIAALLAMSGGELSMAQKQEVFALAAQLGLDEEETRALVRAVERGEPPLPRTSLPRWRRVWLRLKRTALSWWRRLLALLRS